MELYHIRHATSILTYAGVRIMIDPVLGVKGQYDPVKLTPNRLRNPLVELPFDREMIPELLEKVDVILVTHRHNDHFDTLAKEILPKNLPLLCQPEDESAFLSDGFTSVHPVKDVLTLKGIRFTRTGGQHGLLRKDLGPVSGFVLDNANEPTLYIAGDTVWCEEVSTALTKYRPTVVIVNAGGARFLVGGPITMDKCDVGKVLETVPFAKVIAVHMEALNHCILSREQLKKWSMESGVAHRLIIPDDGERLNL